MRSLRDILALFAGQDKSAVGIDFGSAYLKAVQLRRKGGRAVLETYGELALGPYAGFEIGRATRLPPEKLAEALRDVMREAHMTSANAAAAVPFASSLVTIMDMPALPERELGVAVSLEARKYVPVPISEVDFNWWVIPQPPKHSAGIPPEAVPKPDAAGREERERIQVLIAAIHNEAMSRYQSVMSQANLSSGFFEIEIFSAIRSLFFQDLAAHAILDLGAAETKLYLIDQGLLRFSHIINHGAQELTLALGRALNLPLDEAERRKRALGVRNDSGPAAATLRGLLDYIFSEVSQALANYRRRFGDNAGDLVLTGGGANLPGIDEFAAAACGIPVRRADPFAQVEAPAFMDPVLKAVGPEFSVALGVAFRLLEEKG